MPTLVAEKETLQELLNMEFNDDHFERILFDFGLELDDIVEEDGKMMYRIDIPANRYDLLCTEGLCYALKAYLEIEPYSDVRIDSGDVFVHQVGGEERPFIACAIIRDIDLKDEKRYRSFIDYQDKLHLTIGRNRSLCSMGTHDLDKIQTPVFYKSEKPEKIVFVPLNGEGEINGKDMNSYFPPGSKIGKYMRLIENDEKYVYFEDSKGEVMSLPPIINSDGTKISQDTRNMFVEVTGTDLHRVNTALKLIVGCFRGKRIENVEIINGEKRIRTPVMHNHTYSLRLDEINKSLGLSLTPDVVKIYMERMMHQVEVVDDEFRIKVHDIRSDILHKCDIIEDIAVAHGFNNFPRSLPSSCTIGSEVPLNRFSDKLRNEFAMMGFDESLTLTLLSKDENVIDGEYAVVLKNPKSMGYEVSRTSLIPGLMKVIASNLHVRIPFKVFEVSDIVLVDPENECGARNSRRLAAVYSGCSSHLEDVQGPLSLLLEKCGIQNYSYHPYDDPIRYLKNQSALVMVEDIVLGSIGVCHPEICHLFKIPYSASFFEIDVEKLFSIYIRYK